MHHVTQIKEFKVVDTCRDIVVINIYRDDYKAHAHFKDIKGAKDCISLICRGLLPRSRYYKEACRRLLTQEQYNGLIERHKDKYININKGIKR